MKRPVQWLFEKVNYDPYADIEASDDIRQVEGVRRVSRLWVGTFTTMGILLAANIVDSYDAVNITAQPQELETMLTPVEAGINAVLLAPQVGGIVLAGACAWEGVMLHRAATSRLRQLE